jgi:hypothetical protein
MYYFYRHCVIFFTGFVSELYGQGVCVRACVSVCVRACICVCVCVGGGGVKDWAQINPALLSIFSIYCACLYDLSLYQSYTPSEAQNFSMRLSW